MNHRVSVPIRSRWDIEILRAIKEGHNRPSLLQRRQPHLPKRTLLRRLKHLQQSGLIEVMSKATANSHSNASLTGLRLTQQGEKWLQAIACFEVVGLSPEQIVRVCPMLQCPCRLRSLELLLHKPVRPRLLVLGIKAPRKLVFEHLKRLYDLKVVVRKVIPTRPVQVHYRLTPKGERIISALLEARQILDTIS
jgi:DNA-binding HxlR family transcriptional regulator